MNNLLMFIMNSGKSPEDTWEYRLRECLCGNVGLRFILVLISGRAQAWNMRVMIFK